MACTATIKTGRRKGELCGYNCNGREFCGHHDSPLHHNGPIVPIVRKRVVKPPGSDICSICMPKKYTKLECGHYYHIICIAEWFNKRHTNECCLCRTSDASTVISGVKRYFYSFAGPDFAVGPYILLPIYTTRP